MKAIEKDFAIGHSIRTIREIPAYDREDVDVRLPTAGTKGSILTVSTWLFSDVEVYLIDLDGEKIYIRADIIDQFVEKVADENGQSFQRAVTSPAS